MEKEFVFHRVIKSDLDFCNMQKNRNRLTKGVVQARGGRFVIYGRRDTGKTSIVKSLVIPHFRKHHLSAGKESLVIFCDLMSVSDRTSVSQRMRRSLEQGLGNSFPSRLLEIAKSLATLRPTLGLGDDGKPELSLGTSTTNAPDIVDLLDAIARIGSNKPTLVVLDEFQDLHRVAEMEALFRDAFQNFPDHISVVVLGSKKHLLSKIFARPDAPLAGWGEAVNIEPIPFAEYHAYIEERLNRHGLTMPAEVCTQLQDKLQRVPEDINIICQQLLETLCAAQEKKEEPNVEPRVVTSIDIANVTNEHLDASASLYEELLRPLTSRQVKFLTALAKAGRVAEPYSSSFLAQADLPLGTVQKILLSLEDEAIIYRDKEGYSVGKPLLALYLRKYR